MEGCITSRDNERVKHARHLAASAKQRRTEGLLFAEGLRLCLDLAQTLQPVTVFYTQRLLQRCPEAAALAPEAFVVSESVAEKLGDTQTPQGLFALFAMPNGELGQLRPEKGVLLCEDIRDPANVGAMLRSAAAFGLGGAVLSPGCADPFGPKALRAAMGAVGRLPLVCECPLEEVVTHLHGAGCRVYAAALQDARPFASTPVQGPWALLVGNEGAGLSAEAMALADEGVYIPMQNGVESLNAAVAASVLMYRFSSDWADSVQN